jgi:hypothetical protein
MPETCEDVVLSIVGKLLALQKTARKRGLTTTLSIGVVVYLSPPENVDKMIRRADAPHVFREDRRQERYQV